MSKVIIGRAIEGISINGLEFLLDEDGYEMEFDSIDDAIFFLRLNGFGEFTDEDMYNNFSFVDERTREII